MSRYTLAQLAELTGAALIGNPEHLISNVDSLSTATESDASFLENPRYREALLSSQAGVICIDPKTSPIEGKNFLVVEHPSKAFQAIVEILFSSLPSDSAFLGVHPTAVVHPTAKVDPSVQIGPYAVIDGDATVGKGTIIAPHVYVGRAATIGSDCHLHARSTVRERCQLGNRVILQPGAVIGSCGYGYFTDGKGEHHKLKQMGIVILEDDVEIGANTAIDRARFKATRVQKGSKIDNLVQLGHNVDIGPHNLIIAQTGIAGSTKTGRHVVIGGQVGVAGHLEIVSGAMVASKAGVTKSITQPGKYNGIPIQPIAEYNRQQVYMRRIAEYEKRLALLEEKLASLIPN